MDLKIPSQAASPGSVASPLGDLLARLRAAGTVEAEVVRLLNDNQLLLTSRLGQIRTSNTLGYRVGDRIEARLDESSGQAVLKTRRAESKPSVLDGRQYPELMRALPPDRPLLARVVRLLAQQAEIRLPDLVMRIARAPEFKPGQLLQLERMDSGRRIEIRPLQDKAMYKAIVRQLLPVAVRQGTPALVSLLNLAAAAGTGQAGMAQPRTLAGKGGTGADSARAAAAGGYPASTARAPQPAAPRTRLGDSAGPVPPPAAHRDGEPGARDPGARTALPTAARSAAPGDAGDATVLRALRAAASGPRPAAATRPSGIEKRAVVASASPQPAVAAANRPAPLPAARVAAVEAAGDKPAVAVGTGGGTANATDAGAARLPAAETDRRMLAAGAAPAAAIAGYVPAAYVPPALPSLEPLLQLVRQLADIDAPQVRKWFEFARLVRTAADAPQGAADLWRLLRPPGNGETPGRELTRALAKKPPAGADGESAGVRASQAEVSPAQLREGLRLVEQSLAQNLLQRASLGLQQETQQPLNLSLALPFVDQQQIRPLSIDLRQRKQADDPARHSWEVRLGFELGELGCISCHLLLEGSSVAASFFSEHASTRDRIEAELPRLRRQLLRAGFEPGEFHSFAGKPAVSPDPGATDFAESLIDIEA